MATVNSAGNLVIDGNTQEGNALLLSGLYSGRTIRVELVGLTPLPDPEEEGYFTLSVGKYSQYGWDYYDSEEVYYNDGPVDFTLEAGENLVLFSFNESAVFEVSIRYHVDAPEVTNIYEQPSIVPAAVSSQLDVTGEERIHIAPYEEVKIPPKCTFVVFGEGISWYDYSWPAGWSEDYPINVTLKRTGQTTQLYNADWGYVNPVWHPDDYYDWMFGDEVVLTQPETGWEFEAVICEEPFLYVFMDLYREDENGDHFYVWNEGSPWISTDQKFKVTYGGITYDTVYHIYEGSWVHTIEDVHIPIPLSRVPATIELEDGTVRRCFLYTSEPAPS